LVKSGEIKSAHKLAQSALKQTKTMSVM